MMNYCCCPVVSGGCLVGVQWVSSLSLESVRWVSGCPVVQRVSGEGPDDVWWCPVVWLCPVVRLSGGCPVNVR